MLENSARTELSELGEFGLIEHLTKFIKLEQPTTVRGAGDDAAVMRYDNGLTVVSTDLLLEGVHFDLTYAPLKHLGYKAITVNLSDICAIRSAVPSRWPTKRSVSSATGTACGSIS